MPKRCAVDGCKSQSAPERKRMKLLGMKEISVFSAPKNLSQLEKWNEALVGNTKKLVPTDVVCSKHFRKEDIETHYLTELADGSTNLLERGKPSLRANAIPIRLPNKAEGFEKIEKATTNSDPATATLSTTVVSPKRIWHSTIEFVAVKNEEIDDAINEGTDNKTSEATNANEDLSDETDNTDIDDANTDGYSIDSLVRDLEVTKWRKGWVWSDRSNSSCIEFVQFDTEEMQPRIYCCISDSMEITIFVGDKSDGNEIPGGTLGSFAEMLVLLKMMETLKPCAGTGCKAEIRSAACPGFIGDIYAKKSISVRCSSCRVLRHNLRRRKTMSPDAKHLVVVKKLHSLQRRHKTLRATCNYMKKKLEEKTQKSKNTSINSCLSNGIKNEKNVGISSCTLSSV